MSIEKKSLISNRTATKKAILAKPQVSTVAAAKVVAPSRITPNRITPNRITPNRITPNRVKVT